MNTEGHTPDDQPESPPHIPGEDRPGDEAPLEENSSGENLCPECDGTGQKDGAECPNCRGTGVVNEAVGGG